ncbi:MAG: helicase, partial [SAR324 cluster bacterium]|nr:helicase [SAR324 cluster bacterium]
RVDRYGQKRMDEVAIRTMVVEDTMEASILRVLVEKSNQIREDHGFSPPFFGDDRSVLDLIQDKGLDIRIGQTKLDVFTDGMRKEKSNIMPFSDESIQNVLSDCFYGQTDIEMDDVQARMRKTHELVGSRKELEQFVRLGLETLGSKVEHLNDEVYSITIKDKRLGRGLKKIEEFKVTFDPALGLEKPELDVIDLAHPLVRNIIELIKEQSFVSGEHYGRTACVRTNAVERVTFVYNFLVRYSVGTIPASVIEELVTVGISGENPLNAASLDELKNSSALADRRTSEEHKKHLEQALSYPGLDRLIDSKIEGRESELITERQADRKLLEDQGIEDAVAGIDDVSFASRDLLTVTVYYPAPGGRDA